MLEVVVILALLLLLLGAVLWAGGGKTLYEAQGSGIIEAISGALEPSPPPAEELLVLSYNMAYGLGDALQHGRRVDPGMVYDRLDAIIETLAASGADVVLLQEVDFASRRTYDIDQLQYIATALGWGFVARVITWECRYLPTPFWLPQRHVGRLRAGQGVISRYPLVQNTRQRLSQPLTQPLLAPLFSPYHTVQMVDMRCGERSVRLLNVHLEPRDTATRQRQAQELVAFVRHVATPNCVFMGALHSVAAEVTGRPADPTMGQDRTMDIITSGLRDRLRLVTNTPATSLAETPAYRQAYALLGSGLQMVEIQVMKRDEAVSDHLPLMLRLRWALPLATQNRGPHHEHN
ncbi:MAG TPA: endonuclease/exonuclease/phosphatase family protein [Candidatus Tectomicrobia bacterium]